MVKQTDLDAVFVALADPTRRTIVERLSAGESTIGDLARPFKMSPPAISKHLAVLERAGLVRRERRGRRYYCRLDGRPLRHVTEWVAYHQSLWNRQLAQLQDYLSEIGED